MTDFRDAAKALHIATYSGWYRFEQRNGQWAQTEKALTFWKMTALQVDPNDPRHIYLATEHSGLFVSADGGAAWQRANPNVPRLTTVSLLATPGTIFRRYRAGGALPRVERRHLAGAGRRACRRARRQFPAKPGVGRAHALYRRRQRNAAPSLCCHRSRRSARQRR